MYIINKFLKEKLMENSTRRFYVTVCMLALACMSVFAASPTDNPNQMWIGYVDSDAVIQDNVGLGGFPEDFRVGGAIVLDRSLFGRYNGGKIVALAVGYASSVGTTAEVFMRETLDGPDVLKGSGDLNLGWNLVNFDEPKVIDESMEELVFGFYMTLPAMQYGIPTQRYAIVEKSCYLWTQADMDGDRQVWTDLALEQGMLLVKVVIEDENGTFNDMVELVNVRGHDLHVIGDEGEYVLLRLKNVGMNDVYSVGVKYQYNGELFEETAELEKTMAPGMTEKVQIPFPAKGTADVTMTLHQANGQANKIPSSRTLKVWGLTKEVAEKYTRRPVLEFFETETNALIPQFKTEFFMPGFEPYKDRISMISRHIDDQFSVREGEDLQLILDLVNQEKMNVYIPSFTVDRMDKLSDPVGREFGPMLDIIFPDFVGPVYEEALNMPTFASVDVKATINDAKTALNITVSGEIEPGVMGEEPLFLSVFVTEDNVDASGQESKESVEDYVHNAVIRVQPTEMYGKQLPANNGAYSEHFRVNLEEGWKVEDLKIVAFLNRGPENGYYDKEVVNAGEMLVKDCPTGLCGDTIWQCRVYAGDGCVVAEGAGRMEIYDMQGNRVLRNSGLKGLYVVRVSDGQEWNVYKVFVK